MRHPVTMVTACREERRCHQRKGFIIKPSQRVVQNLLTLTNSPICQTVTITDHRTLQIGPTALPTEEIISVLKTWCLQCKMSKAVDKKALKELGSRQTRHVQTGQ